MFPCSLFHPTVSCHAAKVTGKTHRTAELNRVAADASPAKTFYPCTAVLKRDKASEAFRGKKPTNTTKHFDAALFKIWPCAC